MIRKHLVVAVAAASFAGLIGCSATVKAPVVAVAEPAPVAVVEAPPAVVVPPPPRLAAVCDAELSPGGHLHFPHEVEFAVGKATLKDTPTTNAILQCLVDFLAKNPMVTKFRLEGYTDNTGSEQENTVLSQARGDAVVAWMTSHGVDGAKLWAKGYGPKHAIAPNDTPENMAKNRRVEFHVDELNGVKATKESLYLAINPPAVVVAAQAPGVAVAVPGVAVGIPTVAVATPGVVVAGSGVAVVRPGVAVAAPSVAVGVAVPTSVTVGGGIGVGVGGGGGKPAAGKADAKKDDKKKK